MDGLKETIKGAVTESLSEAFQNLGVSLSHFLINTTYALALVGGGILILMYVAGYRKGLRYTGILFVSHVLLRYLLG